MLPEARWVVPSKGMKLGWSLWQRAELLSHPSMVATFPLLLIFVG